MLWERNRYAAFLDLWTALWYRTTTELWKTRSKSRQSTMSSSSPSQFKSCLKRTTTIPAQVEADKKLPCSRRLLVGRWMAKSWNAIASWCYSYWGKRTSTPSLKNDWFMNYYFLKIMNYCFLLLRSHYFLSFRYALAGSLRTLSLLFLPSETLGILRLRYLRFFNCLNKGPGGLQILSLMRLLGPCISLRSCLLQYLQVLSFCTPWPWAISPLLQVFSSPPQVCQLRVPWKKLVWWHESAGYSLQVRVRWVPVCLYDWGVA